MKSRFFTNEGSIYRINEGDGRTLSLRFGNPVGWIDIPGEAAVCSRYGTEISLTEASFRSGIRPDVLLNAPELDPETFLPLSLSS